MKVIANSSVLISLASIEKLTLLKTFFNKIIIPEAVWDEVVVKGKNKVGVEKVNNAKWIEIKGVKNKTLVSALNEMIDYGEAEAIALAIEMNANLILLDEKDARIVAEKYGIKLLGTVGVLLLAKKRNLITDLKKELNNLINTGNFRISRKIYNHAINIAGE